MSVPLRVLVVENDFEIGQRICLLLLKLLAPLGVEPRDICWVAGTCPVGQDGVLRVYHVENINESVQLRRIPFSPEGFQLALLDGNLGEDDNCPAATHGWHLAKPIKEAGARMFYISGLPESNRRMAAAAGEESCQEGRNWAASAHKGTPCMFKEDLCQFLVATGILQPVVAATD